RVAARHVRHHGQRLGLPPAARAGEAHAPAAHLRLEPLPDTAGNAPMLVINGDADPYVPVEDTLMSSGAGTPRSCSLRAAATARSTATRGRQRRARLLTTDVTCRHQGTHEVTIPDSSVAATLVGACARPQLCAELLIHPISCASGTMPSAAVNLSSQQSAPCLVADGHV